MATASSYKCMCISQWSILIAMLLVASVAAAVVIGVGFILKQQSPDKCKPETSGLYSNNTNPAMLRDQMDLGDQNDFDMSLEIDADYINGLKAFEKYNSEDCIRFLESALERYHAFQDSEYGCPRKCLAGQKTFVSFGDAGPGEVEYKRTLNELATLMNQTIGCIKECDTSARRWISEDVHSQFVSMKPYKYLQVCYTEVMEYFLLSISILARSTCMS